MKNIHILLLTLLFISCTTPKYEHIGQEIIDGKVSATKAGIKRHCRGCINEPAIIWVQTTTTTKKVEIPYEYDGKWKVGDNCLLIIEKYKENDTK
jgi:hypothetical protein